MLTDQELQALMADLESARVERKAALSDKNEIRRAICAFANDLPFDQHPILNVTHEDLNWERFRRDYLPLAVAPEVLAENQRTPEEQFASLHFLDRAKIPNVAAVLVFAKDPIRWIPGAYVQFLRIDGTELTDPIRHQEEIKGSLHELIREMDKVLNANISINTEVSNGPIEERQPDYPLAALQQFSRNAVLHRTYESTNAPARVYWFADRIEISSPGGPFGHVNVDNFGEPGITDYRNPLLAEAMKTLGFVQRFGMGIPLALQALKKNGNPEPEFKLDATRVVVTIRKRS